MKTEFLVLKSKTDGNYLQDWHSFGKLVTFKVMSAYFFDPEKDMDTISELLESFPTYEIKRVELKVTDYTEE